MNSGRIASAIRTSTYVITLTKPVVHAFLNACTHKGAELTTLCEAHKASAVSCPFHARTFALDGRLIGVPRQETLLDFKKESRPLVSLVSSGRYSTRRRADFSSIHPQLAALPAPSRRSGRA
jgi:nitrite reductase/ring-hydroxylating ferredoxin subunit